MLNLGGNCISTLPNEIVVLKKLRILFFAGNKFETVPECLGQLSSLFMLSFKSNCLIDYPELALSPSVGWLILTDNKLTKIPNSIGQCLEMRKLMLANNRLTTLPTSLSNCRKLELLRISCNELTQLPDWIYEFPRLAWIASSNNAYSFKSDRIYSVDDIAQRIPRPFIRRMDYDNLLVQGKIGEGASGCVYAVRAKDTQQPHALKLFKSAVTSDGIPYDEVMINCLVGSHPHILCCSHQILELLPGVGGGTPVSLEHIRLGLLFPLLSETCVSLAGPPSFSSVSRDVYTPHPGIQYSLPFILRIQCGIASACSHLHRLGIAHGDIYGHNILIYPDGTPMLVDFGAATIYDPSRLPQSQQPSTATSSVTALSEVGFSLEYMEVLAYGILISELLALIHVSADQPVEGEGEGEICVLLRLYRQCTAVGVSRVRFADICPQLNPIAPS